MLSSVTTSPSSVDELPQYLTVVRIPSLTSCCLTLRISMAWLQGRMDRQHQSHPLQVLAGDGVRAGAAPRAGLNDVLPALGRAALPPAAADGREGVPGDEIRKRVRLGHSGAPNRGLRRAAGGDTEHRARPHRAAGCSLDDALRSACPT